MKVKSILRFVPILAAGGLLGPAGPLLGSLAFLAGATPAFAQGGTDIYLASLKPKDETVKIGKPENITNRPGYDNQPFFTADGAGILFTSIRDDQADIYQYDLESKEILQVTRTAESEYSPTPIPGSTDFSVIQVEADSTQRLWAFTRDGKEARLLLSNSGPVGYHAWGDDADQVAIFVLGEPHFLQLVDLRRGRATTVVKDIGRSLQKIPGRPAISTVHRRGDMWWVEELRLDSKKTRPLIQAVPESQDCAWTPDGVLLMARGTTVFACRPDSTEWSEAARFDEAGIGAITRMAVSPNGDRIALVADEPGPDEE
jgi:WD40 repeat protein